MYFTFTPGSGDDVGDIMSTFIAVASACCCETKYVIGFSIVFSA